jgi:hypothetical protein
MEINLNGQQRRHRSPRTSFLTGLRAVPFNGAK